jgi:hypothetical protein
MKALRATFGGMANRTAGERINHAIERLEREPNVWVATASADAVPHLVPLSLAWINDRVVVATGATTPTVRNLLSSGHARLTLDSADDVVIIEATATVTDLAAADSATLAAYIERVGWNPGAESGEWSLIELTPRRAQAWIGPAEIAGRTIMRDGIWLR